MNCKPGDLAVIVRSDIGNEGKIVTCIQIDPSLSAIVGEPVWKTDTPTGLLNGVRVPRSSDRCLRPIRDQPGNEEFVTKLREKLPRSKPATTKGDTITERGELA